MPAWAVSAGQGAVAHPGLSYNPDAGQHAALLAEASRAEERALLEARLRVARLQPSDRHTQILHDAAAAAAGCGDAAAAGSSDAAPELSGGAASSARSRAHIEPRSRRDATVRVSLTLPFSAPLPADLGRGLRGVKAVGAQLVAAERLSALALRTGMVPLPGGGDAVLALAADGSVAVRRRRPQSAPAFPYRMVEFPRRAPELQALQQQPRGGKLAAAAAEEEEGKSLAVPAAPLALFTGEEQEAGAGKEEASGGGKKKRAARASGGKRGGGAPASSSGRVAGGLAAASASAAGVLRSGVLTASELGGLTLQYGAKAREAWKPQS